MTEAVTLTIDDMKPLKEHLQLVRERLDAVQSENQSIVSSDRTPELLEQIAELHMRAATTNTNLDKEIGKARSELTEYQQRRAEALQIMELKQNRTLHSAGEKSRFDRISTVIGNLAAEIRHATENVEKTATLKVRRRQLEGSGGAVDKAELSILMEQISKAEAQQQHHVERAASYLSAWDKQIGYVPASVAS